MEAAATPFRRLRQLASRSSEADTIWALKDVSFVVEPGEVVGIIGHNGAGKSTLLKILSRITQPTSGTAQIRGRVASLLEVGTGFHAELTGRENIYLNGAILGMARREIQQNFDAIVAFAEVERFIDTPVKRYSSGMYLRLAFAVAAHLQPEILLVDEVLAVGDAAFQKKCLGKMGDVAREGRTVLFISHNLSAVRALCPHTILLDRGRIKAAADTDRVLELYSRLGIESTSSAWVRPAPAEGEKQPSLRVTKVQLLGDNCAVAQVDQPLRIAIEFIVEANPSYVIPGIHFLSSEGLILFSSANWGAGRLSPGRYTTHCEVPPFLLNEGRITVSVYLYNSARPAATEVPVDWISHTVSFDVDTSAWIDKSRSRWLRPWPGLVRPDIRWGECLSSSWMSMPPEKAGAQNEARAATQDAINQTEVSS
ncbi:MAG TPA: ABC transporter ATP-binding protein [Blastocatellia bacterium]|nr:ABC transporter ATP-binding protein [Blastocatellia bacterium]